jgi:hypothetical protein
MPLAQGREQVLGIEATGMVRLLFADFSLRFFVLAAGALANL